MTESAIQIGSISLRDFEVPPSLRFGGQQRLAVQQLVGGQRVIECLGPDEGDIVFEGVFTGSDASTRARAFDSLRLSGSAVWLTWGDFQRSVIVKSFQANYQNPWWIPYRAVCTVALVTIVAGAPTLAAATMTALGNAVTAAEATSMSLTELQTALSAPNASIVGSSDNAQAITVANGVVASIAAQTLALGSQVQSGIPTATSIDQYGQAFATLVENAGTLAASAILAGYAGCVASGLNSEG